MIIEKSLEDIIRDTPHATVGVSRFKRIMRDRCDAIPLFRETLTGVVSETMVTLIFAKAGVSQRAVLTDSGVAGLVRARSLFACNRPSP